MIRHVSAINVTKRYKPRRLKTDPISRLSRQLYKLKSKNPVIKRKRDLYEKKYRRINKQALERREEFVRKAKERLPKPKRDSN